MLQIVKNLLKPIVLRHCKKDHIKKYDIHGNVYEEILSSLIDDKKHTHRYTYDDQKRLLTWVSLFDGRVDMVITHDHNKRVGVQKNYEYENGTRVLKRHSIGYYDEDGILIKSIDDGVETPVPVITKNGNTVTEDYTDELGYKHYWQTLKDKNGRDLFSHGHTETIDGTLEDCYTLTTYRDDGQLCSRIDYSEHPNSFKASYYSRTFHQYDMYGRITSTSTESSYSTHNSRHYYSKDGTEDLYIAISSLTGYYCTFTKKKDNVETTYIIPHKWTFLFK